MRVNQTVGGHFRRPDRRHRRRDGAVLDEIRRLESAKFRTKRAQRARPSRWPYQLCWRRCQPTGVAMRLIIEARLEGGETSETEATIVAVVERQDQGAAGAGTHTCRRPRLARRGSIVAGVRAGCRVDGEPIGLPPLWPDASAQRRPVDRAANCVWQGRRAESEAVDVQLRGKARATAPLRESAVQGRSPACDAGIGVPAGQVGRPSTLPSGH
jgi:hypothetical protein